MSKNIEVKAYCSDLDCVRQICTSLGAHLARDHGQRDTYFAIAQDRLKLRESDKFGSCMIHYRRVDVPSLRESSYTKVDLPDNAAALRDLLSSAVGIRIVVEKQRQTYVLDSALINLDAVSELGSFVEIEVDVEKCGPEKALSYAQQLKTALQISETDIVPWSYSELLAAYQTAKKWRARLAKSPKRGRLFLIDGPSGSGKSTIATRLRKNDALGLSLARRHCTRPRRPNEEDEYIFVSNEEFASMAWAGEFLEYRNFEFGMSYGLSWEEVLQPLALGNDVLAVMDWGNARHVRRIFPDANLILATASQETLRRRLVARGIHNSEQLEERLENAKRFSGNNEVYDLIVSNEDGQLDAVIATIADYVFRPVTQNLRHA